MIIVMEATATERQISHVIDKLALLGFDAHRSTGARHTVIGAVGSHIVDTRDIEIIEGVKEVLRITSPYKLASRSFKPEPTEIKIKDVTIGGADDLVIGG